jgi:hypothetical protein
MAPRFTQVLTALLALITLAVAGCAMYDLSAWFRRPGVTDAQRAADYKECIEGDKGRNARIAGGAFGGIPGALIAGAAVGDYSDNPPKNEFQCMAEKGYKYQPKED